MSTTAVPATVRGRKRRSARSATQSRRLQAEGGQIVITDAYTLSEPFEEPAHSAPVTITGGKLILNHSQYSRYFLSGPVTFENLRIEYGADNAIATGMIVARFNTLVLGDGLEMADGKLFVVGGYQFPTEETIDTKRNSQITIKSGMYSTVVGFSAATAPIHSAALPISRLTAAS